MKVCIVIPAYNEVRKIASVITALKKEGYKDIIVVDDHSTDKTGIVAMKAGAMVIRHRRNRGQGAALRTGIEEAVKRKAKVIVTFDADGQHKASEVKLLVAPLLKGEVDVALGSRFLGSHPGIPWYKWLMLKCSILVERLLLGVWLTDVHNGFRAFSLMAAKKIRIRQDGFAHASEIVYEIRRKGLSYVEVPITIFYDAYTNKKGQSIWNSFRILKELFRIRFGKES